MVEIKEYDAYVIHVLLPVGQWDLREEELWTNFTETIKYMGGDTAITDSIPFKDTVPSTWEGPASGSRRAE